MNKTILWVLGIAVALIVGCALLATGFLVGRAGLGAIGGWPAGMMGYSAPTGPGSRISGYPQGPGMMGGGFGMMGGYAYGSPNPGEPLSIPEAENAVQDFLANLGNPDLILKEVMIFDNHAYAEIAEKSTGIGAMEVLVDPITLSVYPEHGPNMMWNLKYGTMSNQGGFGMMRGMMGGYGGRGFTPDPAQTGAANMQVSPVEAAGAAQAYLDTYLPGAEVDEQPDRFYGYYTLHILEDGEVTGMLSVNGYSAEVFPHTWHGAFIEMSEDE
jgi:hypothetical protein